jgi:hypothetical protein
MAEKGKLDLLNNPMFLRYVEGLPTVERRILAVSGSAGEEVKYVVSLKEAGAGGPPAVVCDSDKENIE